MGETPAQCILLVPLDIVYTLWQLSVPKTVKFASHFLRLFLFFFGNTMYTALIV